MHSLSKIKIAITGGIGSGKTTLLSKFEEKGYKTINLDLFVHDLYKKPSKLYDIVDKEFNLESGDEIDRPKLKKLVFNNDELLKKLNSITHKVIKEELENYVNSLRDSIVIIEIPLLFEAKFEDVVDFIVLAYNDLEFRIKNLIIRDNLTEDQAKNMISKQMNIEDKISLSDYVVNVTNDKDYTYIINEVIEKAGEKFGK